MSEFRRIEEITTGPSHEFIGILIPYTGLLFTLLAYLLIPHPVFKGGEVGVKTKEITHRAEISAKSPPLEDKATKGGKPKEEKEIDRHPHRHPMDG